MKLPDELLKRRNRKKHRAYIYTICFIIASVLLCTYLYFILNSHWLFTALIFIVLLIIPFLLFNTLSYVFDKDYTGTIIEKTVSEEMHFKHNMNKMFVSVTMRNRNDNDYSIDSVITYRIQKDDGSIILLTLSHDDTTIQRYYNIGDRVCRFSGYDYLLRTNNQKEDYIICIECGNRNPKSNDNCVFCNSPLCK